MKNPIRIAASIPEPLNNAITKRQEEARCVSRSELLAAILLDDLLERPDRAGTIAILREPHRVRDKFAAELAAEFAKPDFDPREVGADWLTRRVNSMLALALNRRPV